MDNLFVDVIIYSCPNPESGLDNFCKIKGAPACVLLDSDLNNVNKKK